MEKSLAWIVVPGGELKRDAMDETFKFKLKMMGIRLRGGDMFLAHWNMIIQFFFCQTRNVFGLDASKTTKGW